MIYWGDRPRRQRQAKRGPHDRPRSRPRTWPHRTQTRPPWPARRADDRRAVLDPPPRAVAAAGPAFAAQRPPRRRAAVGTGAGAAAGGPLRRLDAARRPCPAAAPPGGGQRGAGGLDPARRFERPAQRVPRPAAPPRGATRTRPLSAGWAGQRGPVGRRPGGRGCQDAHHPRRRPPPRFPVRALLPGGGAGAHPPRGRLRGGALGGAGRPVRAPALRVVFELPWGGGKGLRPDGDADAHSLRGPVPGHGPAALRRGPADGRGGPLALPAGHAGRFVHPDPRRLQRGHPPVPSLGGASGRQGC